MFPFAATLDVDGLGVHYSKIIDEGEKLLTSDRIAKINQVVSQRDFGVSIILENIYDRGNASAVMRSAEAFGFTQFHMIELSEKFKVANRVASGADKWMIVKKYKSTRDCVEFVKKQGYQICVTHLDEKSVPIYDVDFSKPTALVLGNEKDGVSKEMIELADHRVIIPMQGFVQSFNISVAGAIGLYHIYHERLKVQNRFLTLEQQQILKAYYFLKSMDSLSDIIKLKSQ